MSRQSLAGGRDRERFDFLARALCGRVKTPDGFDVVAEEFDAGREVVGHRIDVNDPTPAGELPGLDDDGLSRIPGPHPRFEEFLQPHGLPDLERAGVGYKVTPADGA